MMRRTLLHIAVFLAAAAIAAVAVAEPQESLLQRTAQRIASPNVAVDLGLSKAQTADRDKLFAAFQVDRTALVEKILAAPADRQDALNGELGKLQSDLDGRLLALLTAGQQRRLLQIGVQEEGSEALLDDMVSREVGLSVAQLAKIRTVYDKVLKAQDDYQSALGEALAKIPDPKPNDTAAMDAYVEKQKAVVASLKPKEKAFLDAKTAGNKQIFNLMTPQQQKKWFALHGKPLLTEVGKRAGR